MERAVALPRARLAPNVLAEIGRVLLNRIAAVTAGLWVVCFLLIDRHVTALNKNTVPTVGVPLGVYLAAQGGMAVFLVLVWLLRRVRMRAVPSR